MFVDIICLEHPASLGAACRFRSAGAKNCVTAFLQTYRSWWSEEGRQSALAMFDRRLDRL